MTTSYTASACHFERTWTITVTDNNGNATTVTDVQTIQVADTSAPDITALENTVASCDLFGFDLSAGDQSTVLAYTSFEEGASGDQYVDTGDAAADHALANNPGQSDVNFTSTGGEMGFSSYYYSTGSNGLTDGDFVVCDQLHRCGGVPSRTEAKASDAGHRRHHGSGVRQC